MDPATVATVDREPHGGANESGLTDFSANTNPKTPDGIFERITEAHQDATRYPPEPPRAFMEAAGNYLDVPPEQVVPTPGGLAAIRLALEVTLEPGDTALLPVPSFGEYRREVRLQGAEATLAPHDEIHTWDPAPFDVAVVCTPNNPTGEAYDPDALVRFADRCRAADTPLLVDEAFLGFTTFPSLAGSEGVIVARSLTKLFGLPGLRMGFAVATDDLRARLERARQTWNMGTPALEAGQYAMRDTGFVEETRSRVAAERARMAATLGDRFDIYPSDAPFLLLDVGARSVDDVLSHARENGFAIRDARTFETLDSHVRIAVRLPEENRALEEVLLDV
ncbi:MAG: histidinol-phosphate transaminase [Halanaeroarchaeum sp.]